jgi:hypothetical protein
MSTIAKFGAPRRIRRPETVASNTKGECAEPPVTYRGMEHPEHPLDNIGRYDFTPSSS